MYEHHNWIVSFSSRKQNHNVFSYHRLHLKIYWTDSQVVLSYLNNERKRFHTFVTNRVKMICDHTDVEQWRYVPSEINPADYASRGTIEKQFTEAKDCLTGPKFLMGS